MEQEEKEVNLNDEGKSSFGKSGQYLLVGAAILIGLLLVALSFYLVNLKESNEPNYDSNQEVGSEENEDVSAIAQTDYYEYPYIKSKWDDSAVIKENDWGEGGRDIFIRFSYKTETPPELVDVVPMHNNETGPVHFAEEYNGRGYIGRLVYPEISEGTYNKAQKQTIENVEIIHDLKKLQEFFDIDSFLDVEKLQIEPKFKEWRLMEDRQRRLFYDVTYTDPQDLSNQITLTYHAAQRNRQNVLSIYSPELENNGNVTATFNDTIDNKVLIIDETSNGYVDVEIDIKNNQAAKQQIEIGLEEDMQPFASVYLSSKDNVFGTTLREKQDNYFCKIVARDVVVTKEKISFSIDGQDFYKPVYCKDFTYFNLHNAYNNYVDSHFNMILETGVRSNQKNNLLFQVTVPSVLMADNNSRFDDKGYFEETGSEYIFERAFGGRSKWPETCPSNVGVGSSYPSTETEKPLLSTDCGLYKYNRSTEKYDIELTDNLNSLLPQSVFSSYANQGLRIITQVGSRLYMVGYPYEGSTFTNLLYIDVSNVSSGMRDSGYLVETRPSLNPAETLVVAMKNSWDDELYVLDLQNLSVRSNIVLPDGHTFYHDSPMDGAYGVMATWKTDSELTITHRATSNCPQNAIKTDFDNDCLIGWMEFDESFKEQHPEIQNVKPKLIETEYVF